jgi:3',5'-cyclic AMP phosphodiesterase CpdA
MGEIRPSACPIAVTSDLHLGITDEAQIRTLAARIAAERPALTVVAGDLGEPLDRFVACLRLFADLPGEVAVLAGNHDVWATGGHHSQALWERDLPEAVRAAGMLWLEDQVWRRDGLAVVGTLAWYDYSAADAFFRLMPSAFFARAKVGLNNDAHYIDWPWSDQDFAARLDAAFGERLARLEVDPDVRAVLVVTHVPIFEEQMPRKPGNLGWGLSNAYFGNLTLGQRVLGMRKVRAVVSGHTHIGRSGAVARPRQRDRLPLPVAVVASGYGAPAYLTLGCADLGVQ